MIKGDENAPLEVGPATLEKMSSFLERYEAGEHIAVWDELCALGSSVRGAEYLDDAMAVARATMERVERNVLTLRDRLASLGFEFAYPAEAYVPALPNAMERFEAIEAARGTMSLSCRAWFERFHSVCFVQSEAQMWHEPQGPEAVRNLGYNARLIVLPLESGLEAIAEFHSYWEEDREAGATHDFNPRLWVGACLSNNDVAGFGFGERGMDDPLYGADGREDARFIYELRRVIGAGGFPFWAWWHQERPNEPCWVPAPGLDRVLPFLTEDLVAF